MPSPHDRLVKSVLGEPRYAAQLFARFLPPRVTRWLNLSSLTRVDRSFVDAALSERHADLLFSVALRPGSEDDASEAPPREGAPNEALVYVLFEHQSTPDPLMPYRLLSYMMRVWERWRRDHPGARGLPLVLPLVLYHGASGWSAPRDLAALIDLPAGAKRDMAEALPGLAYDLLDLSDVPEEELTGGALIALVLLLLKHHARGDLVEHLDRWRGTLRRAMQEGGLRAVELVANYTVLVNTHPDTLPRLAALAGEVLGDTAQESAMTAGEMLIERGRAEGRQEGRQEGLQEGRRDEAARLLLRMLTLKFGEVPQAVQGRVQAAELETLEAWTERIFIATQPEEVVA